MHDCSACGWSTGNSTTVMEGFCENDDLIQIMRGEDMLLSYTRTGLRNGGVNSPEVSGDRGSNAYKSRIFLSILCFFNSFPNARRSFPTRLAALVTLPWALVKASAR